MFDTADRESLLTAADALTQGESDGVANMANIAALLMHSLPGLNWAGFYRREGDGLVLGPFQGRPACIRIAAGKGVCGTAMLTGKSLRVADVHAFPGHIACDALSRSELVVPVLRGGEVIAVIDLDSPLPDHFTARDEGLIEALATLIAGRI